MWRTCEKGMVKRYIRVGVWVFSSIFFCMLEIYIKKNTMYNNTVKSFQFKQHFSIIKWRKMVCNTRFLDFYWFLDTSSILILHPLYLYTESYKWVPYCIWSFHKSPLSSTDSSWRSALIMILQIKVFNTCIF